MPRHTIFPRYEQSILRFFALSYEKNLRYEQPGPRVSQLKEKKHPENVATDRASQLFNDTSLTHFSNILKKGGFSFKRPTGESEESVVKTVKTKIKRK